MAPGRACRGGPASAGCALSYLGRGFEFIERTAAYADRELEPTRYFVNADAGFSPSDALGIATSSQCS